MLSFNLKFACFVDASWLCQAFWSIQAGTAGDDEITNVWGSDLFVGGAGDDRRPGHRGGWMLHLLRAAAALRDLLSAPGRPAAIPHGGGDRHGGEGVGGRAPHSAAISHRHGAADGYGCAGRRPVRADPGAICDAAARRDGRSRARNLRAGGAALRLLRPLSQSGAVEATWSPSAADRRERRRAGGGST